MTTEVVAVNIAKKVATLSDSRSVPITNLLDAWGGDTTDPAEAVAFVCGAGRQWWALYVADFEPASSH